MSIRAWLARGLLRIAAKPFIHNPAFIVPANIRARTDGGGDKPWPKTVQATRLMIEGIEAFWITPQTLRSDAVCYYLHGGGYVFGGPHTSHRKLICFLAEMSGMRVLALNYRKAPEHPYPAAVKDALAGYQHLLQNGIPPPSIAVCGDSAGGGLTAALVLKLKGQELPLPACIGLLSPWLDLATTGASISQNLKTDHIIPGDLLPAIASYYAGDTPLREPGLSPLYGDFSGFPPAYIQASSSEVLRDDSTRLEAKLRDAGVPVALDIWRNLPHVWQISPNMLPEAKASLQRLSLFIRSHVQHGEVRDGLPRNLIRNGMRHQIGS